AGATGLVAQRGRAQRARRRLVAQHRLHRIGALAVLRRAAVQCCRTQRAKRSCPWWTAGSQNAHSLSPTQPHKELRMAKVLVLYHSFYGHVEAMASAVAEGARQVSGAKVELKRVPETVPAEVFQKAGGKSNQAAPIATPDELA